MINIVSSTDTLSESDYTGGKIKEEGMPHKPSLLHQEKNMIPLFNAFVEFTNTGDKRRYIEALVSLGADKKEAQEMANLAESRRIAAKDLKKAELLSKRLKLK